MKKILKWLPALIIICCVIFLACTVIKLKESADVLTAQITTLETANAALTEEKAALQSALEAKDAELTEANSRLEHAEATLNDALAVVQSILENLDGTAAEESADEAEVPAVEETAAEAAEVTEEAPAEETAEEAAAE